MRLRELAVAAALLCLVTPAQASDGRWECRAGAALLGQLGVDGSTYVWASTETSSGRGALGARGLRSDEYSTMTAIDVDSGVLREELGIVWIGYHDEGLYPSLTLYNTDGAAATCFEY